VKHLAELGHRRTALVAGPVRDESSSDREFGYQRATKGLGLNDEAFVIRRAASDLTAADVEKLRSDGTTAVLLETDNHAHKFLGLATDLGLDVPAEMSFAVLGDPLNPVTEAPSWTSFRIPREDMGRASIKVL